MVATEAKETKEVCDHALPWLTRKQRAWLMELQRSLAPGAAGNWAALQHPATHEQVLFYTLSDLPGLRIPEAAVWASPRQDPLGFTPLPC